MIATDVITDPEDSRQDELYLQHYGVLGMRWGVRKKERRAYRSRVSALRKSNMTPSEYVRSKKSAKRKMKRNLRNTGAEKFHRTRQVARRRIKARDEAIAAIRAGKNTSGERGNLIAGILDGVPGLVARSLGEKVIRKSTGKNVQRAAYILSRSQVRKAVDRLHLSPSSKTYQRGVDYKNRKKARQQVISAISRGKSTKGKKGNALTNLNDGLVGGASRLAGESIIRKAKSPRVKRAVYAATRTRARKHFDKTHFAPITQSYKDRVAAEKKRKRLRRAYLQ